MKIFFKPIFNFISPSVVAICLSLTACAPSTHPSGDLESNQNLSTQSLQLLEAPELIRVGTFDFRTQVETGTVLSIDYQDNSTEDTHLEIHIQSSSAGPEDCQPAQTHFRIPQSVGSSGLVEGFAFLHPDLMNQLIGENSPSCIYALSLRAIEMNGPVVSNFSDLSNAMLFSYQFLSDAPDPHPSVTLTAPELDADTLTVDRGNADGVLDLGWINHSESQALETEFIIKTADTADANCPAREAFHVLDSNQYADGDNRHRLFPSDFMLSVMAAEEGCTYQVQAIARHGIKVSARSNSVSFQFGAQVTDPADPVMDLAAPVIESLETSFTSDHLFELMWTRNAVGEEHTEIEMRQSGAATAACPALNGQEFLSSDAYPLANGFMESAHFSHAFMQNVGGVVGCEYQIRLRAIAGSQHGPWSNVKTLVYTDVDSGAPVRPAPILVSGVFQSDNPSGMFQVTWMDTSNGEAALHEFQVFTLDASASCPAGTGMVTLSPSEYETLANGTIVSDIFSQTFLEETLGAQEGCRYEVSSRALYLDGWSATSSTILEFTYLPTQSNTGEGNGEGNDPDDAVSLDFPAPTISVNGPLPSNPVVAGDVLGINFSWFFIAPQPVSGEVKYTLIATTKNPSAQCPAYTETSIVSRSVNNQSSLSKSSVHHFRMLTQNSADCVYEMMGRVDFLEANTGEMTQGPDSSAIEFTYRSPLNGSWFGEGEFSW